MNLGKTAAAVEIAKTARFVQARGLKAAFSDLWRTGTWPTERIRKRGGSCRILSIICDSGEKVGKGEERVGKRERRAGNRYKISEADPKGGHR